MVQVFFVISFMLCLNDCLDFVYSITNNPLCDIITDHKLSSYDDSFGVLCARLHSPCNGSVVSSYWTNYFDNLDIVQVKNIFYSKYDKQERRGISCSPSGDIVAIVVKNAGLTGLVFL